MVPNQKTIRISGMSCGNCAKSVKRALEQLPGVVSADVSAEEKRALVTFDNATIPEEALAEAVRTAGFKVDGVD